MDHGQGPGAARGSKERQRHRGREDPRPASQEEWSTGKVGVTVARLDNSCLAVAFPRYRGHFLIPSSRPSGARPFDDLTTDVSRVRRHGHDVASRIPLSNRHRMPCSFRHTPIQRLADKDCRKDTSAHSACTLSQFSPRRPMKKLTRTGLNELPR